MYQALYRKYRPRTFSDVTGQEHVTETLRRQIISGRLSHAYLFVGTRGTGKTTCAKILSRAVNCEAPVDGNPCNKCVSCTGIENGSILDVLELDAASNNGVDNVRELREEAIYSPAFVKKRVYIVDEVHMLSTPAFNALLKILEEPPEHLIFILATTELHKVPATILSRCQRYSFKRLSPASISERLIKVATAEGLDLSADAVEKLAALADGSMRDGLSLLDQCATDTVIDLPRVLDTVGLAGAQQILSLAEAIASRDTAAALRVLENLYDDGRDMAALLNEIGALVRDLLVCKLDPDSPLLSGGFSRPELSGLSDRFTSERLFSCLEVIRETTLNLSRSGSARLAVEMCHIRLCDERLSDDAAAMLARIARLETGPQTTAFTETAISTEPQSRAEPDKQKSASPKPVPKNVLAEGVPAPGVTPGDSAADAPAPEPQSNESADMSLLSSIPGETGFSPEPQSDVSEKSDGGFWQDILELLKSEFAVYAALNDSSKVQAELRDNVLMIRTSDGFIAGSIRNGTFTEPLKEAAYKALGREVAIRVESVNGEEAARKPDSLESLSRFGIVKFE